MNLLLLLSALLSALTGVAAGPRVPDIARTVSQSAAAVRPAMVATAIVARRPVQRLPNLASMAAAPLAAPRAIASAIAIWASRRRE